MRDLKEALVEDAIAQRSRALQATMVSKVEFAVLVVLAAAHGYALGRKAFLGGMGLEVSKERDLWFRGQLAEMVKKID